MERRLKPLSVHLAMASANMAHDNIAQIPGYAAQSNKGLSADDAVKMVRGIKEYQQYPHKIEPPPTETIWSEGSVSIRKPAGTNTHDNRGGYPLLLVPSLINKSSILDITHNKSVLRWFAAAGVDVYLLDWGALCDDKEKDITLDDLIASKLTKSIQWLSEIKSMSVDVMGYCMGGTMLLGAYAHIPDAIRRMVLLASPWDFHSNALGWGCRVKKWAPVVKPVISEKGHLPHEMLQALFASLDPDAGARKFINFADMKKDSDVARLFVAVEDWLNDGVDIPHNIAQYCIQEWFIKNKTVSNEWCVANKVVDPSKMRSDILIIASEKDNLVPYECAASLANSLQNEQYDMIKLQSGHVGMIVGRQAINQVWSPALEWLQQK